MRKNNVIYLFKKESDKLQRSKREFNREKVNNMIKTEGNTFTAGRLLTREELESFDEFMKFENSEVPADQVDISKGVEDFLKKFREEMREFE